MTKYSKILMLAAVGIVFALNGVAWSRSLTTGHSIGNALFSNGKALDYRMCLDDIRRIPAKESANQQKNTLINLRKNSTAPSAGQNRGVWLESQVTTVTTSGQGLVDAIVGGDGNMYCAYYDDEVFPSNPGYNSVYVKKSTDGGATWGFPDSGSNGFALYGMFVDRPSIEVFETTTGNYRMAVAMAAPYPYQSSPYNIIICWKDLGAGDDFTLICVQNDTGEDYIIPRIKAIRRPSNPSLKRIVCASYSVSDGRLWCDYSDTNASSWGNYSSINPGTDQEFVWRADFIEDINLSRLYCAWSVAVSATPDNPSVIMALSTSNGTSWFSTLYRMSPAGWTYCAESDAAICVNPSITNRTLMLAWSGQQTASSLFNVYYSYQFLSVITVGPGDAWNPSPTGYPVIYGTVYSDTNYDNTMPALIADNRVTGGYRVALLDQHQASLAQVRYSECTFDTPVNWIPAEIVSAPAADPARQGSTALSMGVGYNATTYPNRRCAVWPDFRDPDLFVHVYAAWSDFSTTPSATPTVTIVPTLTNTPTRTASPTPTITPTPGIIFSNTPTTGPSTTPPPTGTISRTPSPTPSYLAPLIPTTTPIGILLLLSILTLLFGWKLQQSRE